MNWRGCGSNVITPKGAPIFSAAVACDIDNRAVAQMDPVKIADRGGSAPICLVHICVIPDDPHGAGLAPALQGRCKPVCGMDIFRY
jgi:hypothetical protein